MSSNFISAAPAAAAAAAANPSHLCAAPEQNAAAAASPSLPATIWPAMICAKAASPPAGGESAHSAPCAGDMDAQHVNEESKADPAKISLPSLSLFSTFPAAAAPAQLADGQNGAMPLAALPAQGLAPAGGAEPLDQCATSLALVDSGRESTNEGDFSFDDSFVAQSDAAVARRCKKPCTLDFYRSSGCQSKWYLPPPFLSASSTDIIKINISSPMDACLMTVSTASIAEPESSTVTPPSDSQATQDDEMSASENRFLRSAATNDGLGVMGARNGFLTNLSQQMRAVSSPSLTETVDGAHQRAAQSHSTKPAAGTANAPSVDSATIASSQYGCPATSNHNGNTAPAPVGVLQKFKRTLTNFNKPQQTLQQQQHHHHQQQQLKQSSTVASQHAANYPALPSSASEPLPPPASNYGEDPSQLRAGEAQMSADVTDSCSNKYRFGPLVWRSSKERRKTKYNRRDKCNSGDSGIQIELENDEQFARVLTGNGIATNGSSSAAGLLQRKQSGANSSRLRAVRRTNSAKVTPLTDQQMPEAINRSKVFECMDMGVEREAPESLPTRSLSQPNGLESCGMSRNDLDDSDSDSVTSHEEVASYFPIYAEVLYNFTAAGPQELGLEKGTLIEILRKEIGPWWFGRIKKEDASLVEEILDPELGWFPKEFVRVIHSPETDAVFLRHLAEEEERLKAPLQGTQALQKQMNESNQMSPPCKGSLNNTSSSAPGPAAANASKSDDECNATVIDMHNVTTIVIESSASPMPLDKPAQTQQRQQSPQDQQRQLHNAVAAAKDSMDQKQLQRGCSPVVPSANGQAILSTSQSLNLIMGSTELLRRSAVKELLDTEVNYVKLLQAICEGYLPAMSKRIDIFSPNSIRLIFSNITAIYKFQRRFLDALRKGIEQDQVAKVFLKMHKGFLCYSTYCNSYPRALIELESYERVKDARTILDNCRESENLPELPLSAHLLAPVQRICRYPLHLGEMIKTSLKSTEPSPFSLTEYEQIDVSQLDIADTMQTMDMALEAMKSITEAVNEGKRHSETIARHQSSFQNFKGPPLHLHSTRFFLQLDATRQKQNLWNSSCTLFLFDNQLVYCKKDLIKRSHFIYKGRIFLDRCRVVNVRDGKMFGHTIKNSLRIYCEARDKWFDFCFRSANRKHRFLNTLALERQFGGKALYISEMTGFEYAFEERDCSDQSDYEGADNEQLKLKEFLSEQNLPATSATTNSVNNSNTSGDSSVPESPAKSFKYSDTLPKKSAHRLEPPAQAGDHQTGSLGRRRLGNWFRKPKSSASTPNQSPTHRSLPSSAHSTGDLQLTYSGETETYTVLEHSAASGGGVSS